MRNTLVNAYKIVGSILAVIVVFGVSVSLLVWSIVSFIIEPKCDRLEEVSGRDTRFHFPGGCYIQIDDGTYIQDDQFVIHESEE